MSDTPATQNDPQSVPGGNDTVTPPESSSLDAPSLDMMGEQTVTPSSSGGTSSVPSPVGSSESGGISSGQSPTQAGYQGEMPLGVAPKTVDSDAGGVNMPNTIETPSTTTNTPLPSASPIATPTGTIPDHKGGKKGKGKMGKVALFVVGMLLLVGGFGAAYNYYQSNVAVPKVAEIKFGKVCQARSKGECETLGCMDDKTDCRWDREEEACKKRESSACKPTKEETEPNSCVNKSNGECLVVDDCRDVARQNLSGDCYKGGQKCCSKATNTEGNTGGGTGFTGICTSSGCDVQDAFPGCYVTHYRCNESNVGSCNEITVANNVRSASFTQSCGTEQIDVTCQQSSYWRCSSGNGGRYSDEATCKQYCGDINGENNNTCDFVNETTTVHAGSSSKSYGVACKPEKKTRSVCNRNNQCVEQEGEGEDECSTNSDCREDTTESLVCVSLTKDVATPRVGDELTFVCRGRHSANGNLSYDFRYRVGNGAFTSLTANANSATLTVDRPGVWEVQCRACGTVNGRRVCSASWQGATQ